MNNPNYNFSLLSNFQIGITLSFERIKSTFDYVFLAHGMQDSNKIGILNESAANV